MPPSASSCAPASPPMPAPACPATSAPVPTTVPATPPMPGAALTARNSRPAMPIDSASNAAIGMPRSTPRWRALAMNALSAKIPASCAGSCTLMPAAAACSSSVARYSVANEPAAMPPIEPTIAPTGPATAPPPTAPAAPAASEAPESGSDSDATCTARPGLRAYSSAAAPIVGAWLMRCIPACDSGLAAQSPIRRLRSAASSKSLVAMLPSTRVRSVPRANGLTTFSMTDSWIGCTSSISRIFAAIRSRQDGSGSGSTPTTSSGFSGWYSGSTPTTSSGLSSLIDGRAPLGRWRPSASAGRRGSCRSASAPIPRRSADRCHRPAPPDHGSAAWPCGHRGAAR